MKRKKLDKPDEAMLASVWDFNFKNAMVGKSDYTTRWNTYKEAYDGSYFKNKNLPNYKSDLVSNYVFSIIETVRPIMLDNDPKFQSMPRQPEAVEFCNDLQEALMYEWDRENMNSKLYDELINVLVYGTSVFFVPWDAGEQNVKVVPVNPFNIFPDPLATSIDDAEYIIYATYQNAKVMKEYFPEKADKLSGSSINYTELVQENGSNSRVDNQILILEVWTKDYEVDVEKNGDKEKYTSRYPRGRVITICPELGIVLDDKENPYEDGRFPFVLIKDYGIPGKFWGEGEVTQLLSPQKYMNELNNSIIDNAKATANMPWIVDKNAGVGYGKISSMPGLIIRKNPGAEVRRDQPPSMPGYVINAVETIKSDIEQVSGIYNTLKGGSATGVYTAQGILALQEAGQVRIRLKVKMLENSLAQIAQMWFSRIKQYWKDDRWISVSKVDGSYDVKAFTKEILKYDYNIRITAGSTMPVNRGAMLDLMIRLAQTPMPDGQPLVDREAVITYLPEEAKSALMKRMNDNKGSMDEVMQAIQETQQGLQSITQESKQNDDKTFGVIEQITSTIENLNQQILQMQEKYDKMNKEKVEQEKIDKIKKESYDTGYSDAESMYSVGQDEMQNPMMGIDSVEGLDEVNGIQSEDNSMQLPDEILQGISSLSDDELELLMMENPNLSELIK